MTEDEFLEARDLIAEAIDRAVKVLGSVSGRVETATLDIWATNEAVLTTWEAEGDYDGGYTMEKHEQSFPARLLFSSDDEVAAWRAETRKANEAKIAADRKAYADARLADERATYEQLKRKFG